jgi:hypothetical protein
MDVVGARAQKPTDLYYSLLLPPTSDIDEQ